MCGIPMAPVPDAARGRRLTFARALEHAGGVYGLITENGWRLIDQNRRDYLWKYPGHAYCTFCQGDAGDFRARHNATVSCPLCGREVIFKHESRGHGKIYDEFCLYEWRKSAIDREVIVLTAAFVWRDSTRYAPECEALKVRPCALYVFRPGKAVTVYKRNRYDAPVDDAEGWSPRDTVTAAHTSYMGGKMAIVQDYSAFLEAMHGTRIGETFLSMSRQSYRFDTLELTAIANCARRPYLEYLDKCGQGELAAEIMRMGSVPREVIPCPRAKTPRGLTGLTEAQWHEVRRDGIRLDTDTLICMTYLRRMGLGNLHMDEIRDIIASDGNPTYHLAQLAPAVHRRQWQQDPAYDILIQARTPEKLRRKVCRRMVRELKQANEWRDYLEQLRRLGEDMTSPALLLPRDMPEMHQRMIERERLLRAQGEAKRLAAMEVNFRKNLPALRRDYTFRARGLILRPYESAAEVIHEGTDLHICIGSYAERYLTGGTILCCLRQANEPDEPWRAVEFSTMTGRLVQDRGYANDTKGGVPVGVARQLRLFRADFERHRANNRQRRQA